MTTEKPVSLLKRFKNLLGVGPHLILLGLLLEVLTLALWSRISFPIPLAARTQVILSLLCLMICFTGMTWFHRSLNLIRVNLLDGENRLITRGPFNYVRHPLYATLLLTFPLLPILWCQDLLFLIPWILLIALAHLVVKREERRLLRIFGKEYEDYRRFVPALLPYKGAGGKRFREHSGGSSEASGNLTD